LFILDYFKLFRLSGEPEPYIEKYTALGRTIDNATVSHKTLGLSASRRFKRNDTVFETQWRNGLVKFKALCTGTISQSYTAKLLQFPRRLANKLRNLMFLQQIHHAIELL